MSQSNQPQLPPGANLQQLRNQAKDLRKSSTTPSSIARLRKHHPRFRAVDATQIAQGHISLTDAQLVIARELGFASWPQLKRRFENESQQSLSMHQAVKSDGIDAVVHVYEHNAVSIHELSELGHSPLYTAALYRNQDAIDFLLEQGVVLDIFACCYLGRCAEAEHRLRHDAKLVNQRTKDGMTPLHYAARAGHSDVVKVLLKHGADTNATDHDGGTPILEACHSGPWKRQPATEIINQLLAGGAQVDLHTAAAMGRMDLVAELLDEAPSAIDDFNNLGQTALFLAAKNNHFDVTQLLVQRGANVNLSDAVGIAALHRTSQECSDELIRFLIDNGADAHLCCHVACGDEEGTLASLVANPAAAEDVLYEFNAVGYAIHSWQLGTLRILLKNGCSLSSEDQKHVLRISGDEALLDELLSLGQGNKRKDR